MKQCKVDRMSASILAPRGEPHRETTWGGGRGRESKRWAADGPNDGYVDAITRVVIMALAVVLALNLLPRSVSVGLAIGGVLFLFLRMRLANMLVALSVMGLFLFALVKDEFEISATLLVIAQLALMVIILAMWRRAGPRGLKASKSEFWFLAWAASLYLLVMLQFAAGPGSEFSDFQIRYFLVYATYYIVTGVLIYRVGIRLESILLPSVFFLSLIYPLMKISVWDLSSIASAHIIGLRDVEGYGAISDDRIAALGILIACISLANAKSWMKALPEAILGIAMAAPIVWYSYTRQSMFGALLGVGLIVYKMLVDKGIVRSKWRKAIIVLALVLSSGVAVRWMIGASGPGDATRFSSTGLFAFQDESSQTRLDLWRISLDYIAQRPVAGYGMGGFGELYAGGHGAWPHNWFLEAWLEYGIAGLAIFVMGGFILVRSFFRTRDWMLAGWMIIGMFWLFVVQVSGNIPNNAEIFLFIAIAALTQGGSSRTSEGPWAPGTDEGLH